MERRLYLPHLPGHGDAPEGWRPTPVELCTAWQRQLPAHAIWIGWSLGGLLALLMASLFPASVRALVLITATPRFTSTGDWPAMPGQTLAGFQDLLATAPQRALRRFAGLVQSGVPDPSSVRSLGMEHQQPVRSDLDWGLNQLRALDLREPFRKLQLPILALLGEGDALIPRALAERLHALQPAARVEVLPSAGHALFLSHPEIFDQTLTDWIHHID